MIYPKLSDGSILKTDYTYNKALGWVNTVTNTKGTTVLSSYEYGYDNNGNITTKKEKVGTAAVQTTSYTYDGLNRLLTITRSDGSMVVYTYDVKGNRQTVTDTLTMTDNLSTVSYAYDLTNTLTSVSKDTTTTSFDYMPDGLRYQKTTGSVKTQYGYNSNGEVISETKGTSKATYVRGDRLLVKKDLSTAGQTKDYYYLYNGHGDVVQMVDASGAVVNSYVYDEWGNITNQTEGVQNSFKYAGEIYDEETGLYYLRARYYDPSIGRFINEDTYEGQIDNPLSLNLYTYVTNNPLRYNDPSGHEHTEIGVSYTDADRATIAAYQQLYAMGQSQKDAYLMQAAHDGANLIRLKYERTVNRTIYVDYYTGKPSKNRGVLENITLSMYKELSNGNITPVPMADVLMNTVGFIGGPGEMKIAYTITTDAVEAVMKHWGKTTGKKAVGAFEKSAAKGFVGKEGINGIKRISGFEKGGKNYTFEIKVKNQEFESYRIYGYEDKSGAIIFDRFGKHL